MRDPHTGWLRRLFKRNRDEVSDASAPLVSVIIPTYNWSSVLRFAIESVRWQTMRDFELLVIGDGCTDDSEQIAKSFKDPRIRWHNLPSNTGHQSGPNNAGIAMARGCYVAYLGHDDIWHPTHLALLVKAGRRSGADFVNTRVVMLGPPGSHVRVVSSRSRYREGRGIPPSSLMHVRTLATEIGGWCDYRETELPPEKEFALRAFRAGKRFETVDALTVFKFNSALRPNCYRDKPCHEQAEYVRRIRSEPDFMTNEWRAIEKDAKLGLRVNSGAPEAPSPMPPGWKVSQWRRIRGLEP